MFPLCYNTRIVFWGTQGQELTNCHLAKFVELGSNLVGFVEAPLGTISTVHTEQDPYEGIHEVAARLGKPLLCTRNPKDPAFINELRALEPDMFVIISYQFYLTKQVLSIPPQGAINFHTSLLPRHAGMHPGFWTIWYGDRETGMVVHYLDEGIDTGDIIYETKVPVIPGDTIDALYHRVWNTSIPLVERLLIDLENRTLPRRPQDQSKYLYNYEITEKDFELDFRQPAETLYGRIKMSPGDFYFTYQGQRYHVVNSTVVEELTKTRKYETGHPYVMNGKLVFVTPRRFLQIEQLLKEGKPIDPLGIVSHGR
jgi:methionyl-tRNA formyltransferase